MSTKLFLEVLSNYETETLCVSDPSAEEAVESAVTPRVRGREEEKEDLGQKSKYVSQNECGVVKISIF